MKKLLFILSLLVVQLPLMAQQISSKEASEKAVSFLSSQSQAKSAYVISDTLSIAKNGFQLYYVFSFQEGGFVIISAYDGKIWGYSTEHDFDSEHIPPHVQFWLNQYSEEIYSEIIENTADHVPAYNNESLKSGAKSVSPLLTTKWGQNCNYNELCPVDTFGPCSHTVTGCVATAMAQIMKFWNYPAHGMGTHSYVHPLYGNLSADFGLTTYNWALMNDSLTGPNTDVATLMYHCGIAADMDYGATSSGGSVTPASWENYFRYSMNATLEYRSMLDSLVWNERLKTELDGGRPVLYVGFPHPPMPVGHAWVCDGYDSSDFFHFNWGWDGTFDGYFQMGNFVYSLNNYALMGIMPVQQCDIAMQDMVSPVSATFTTPVPIIIKLANYDTLAHWDIPVAYRVDGGPYVYDTITDTLAPLTSMNFEFSQLCDFTTLPGHAYQMEILAATACDSWRDNDTMRFEIEHVLCADMPYSMGFEPGESLTGWVNENVNEDEQVWYYGSSGGHDAPACYYTFGYDDPSDDWLITKCLTLDTGKLYRLTYWYHATSILSPTAYSVYLGGSPQASSMLTLLQDFQGVSDQNYIQAEIYFSVTYPGNHYIGWWFNNLPHTTGLILDDILIEERLAPDAGITELLAPSGACDLQTESVVVNVKNFCSDPLFNIPLAYRVNGGSIISDTLHDTITMGGTLPFTFLQPYNFAAGGDYEIEVFTRMTGDTIYQNDTLRFTIRNVLSGLLPYSMGFELAEDVSDWRVENTNEDSYTWQYVSSGGHNAPRCVRYDYSSWIAADDWLFTKCIYLESGKTYRLSFWHKIESNQWPENLGVYFGNLQESSAMNQLIVDLPGLMNMTWVPQQSLFSVPADAHYYIGWNCYSDALMFNLYVDDIYLEETTVGIDTQEQSDLFGIYPNPSIDGIYTLMDKLENQDEKVIRIFSMDGRLIQEYLSFEKLTILDLSNKASGMYFVVVNTGGRTSRMHIVKE